MEHGGPLQGSCGRRGAGSSDGLGWRVQQLRGLWLLSAIALVARGGCVLAGAVRDSAGCPSDRHRDTGGHADGSEDDGLYIEGAIAYVEVVDQGGRVVVQSQDVDDLGDKALAREQLPTGTYEVRTYVRSCVGNCGELDPPSDHCETTVDLLADSLVEVHITRRVGQPCEIAS